LAAAPPFAARAQDATAPPRYSIYLPLAARGADTLDKVAGRLLTMDLEPRAEKDVGEWAWKGGVGMIGLLAAADAGAAAPWDLRLAVAEWLDDGLAAGFAGAFAHPNHTAPAWAALRLSTQRAAAGERPADRHLALAERGVRWLLEDAPRAGGALEHRPGQLWDDTLFMSAPLLAEYGARYDRREALDAAAREVRLHAALLQDADTGLWHHGWDVVAADAISGAFWARGNGWAALATSEVLRQLPQDHPERAGLIAMHQRHLRGLLRVQDRASGLWHTVVDRPDFYLETSGSAAIAAALYRAVSDGYLQRDYLVFADQAHRSVLRRIGPDGTVSGVSAGTGVPSRAVGIEIYGRIDTSRPQAYGQGLVLLLLAAENEARALR
jgi:unsaturated rhamnogalacturonyl hydrolase